MEEGEFTELRNQIDVGRAHDVTVVIGRGDELVVIRKPQYPPHAYRAPSGGVHPEESFLDGALREAKEETGLDVEITAYLLYVLVTFSYREETAKWTTHVLLARPLSEELGALDRAEIASARWIGWDELLSQVNPVLRDSGLGGLAYRARVHEKVHELLTARRENEG